MMLLSVDLVFDGENTYKTLTIIMICGFVFLAFFTTRQESIYLSYCRVRSREEDGVNPSVFNGQSRSWDRAAGIKSVRIYIY